VFEALLTSTISACECHIFICSLSQSAITFHYSVYSSVFETEWKQAVFLDYLKMFACINSNFQSNWEIKWKSKKALRYNNLCLSDFARDWSFSKYLQETLRHKFKRQFVKWYPIDSMRKLIDGEENTRSLELPEIALQSDRFP